MHNFLGSISKTTNTGYDNTAVIAAFSRERQEKQEFKVINGAGSESEFKGWAVRPQ